MLPWLVVYRRPRPVEPGTDPPRDLGTARLARAESSWLVAEPDDDAPALVETLVGGLGRGGPFLLIELWSRRRTTTGDTTCDAPRFRLAFDPDDPRLARPVAALASALARIELSTGPRAEVELVPSGAPSPSPSPSPPERSTWAPHGAVSVLGLEVEPVYRELAPALDDAQLSHATFERLYPLVLTELQRELSRGLREAAAIYLEHASNAPVCPTVSVPTAALEATAGVEDSGVRAWSRRLGRASLSGETRAADARLARIDRSIEFLLLVTPTNTREAWDAFQDSGYRRAPRLLYRPLPFDPVELKRELYDARVETIDDPVLGHLLREKQEELDRRITMLLDRGTERFLLGSLQVYGAAEPELLDLAERLLAAIDPSARGRGARVGHDEFARRAEQELDWYRHRDPRLTAQVEVRDDLPPSLVVSGDRLCIGVGMEISEERVDALLQHEVGTHLVTRFNGTRQPLVLLSTGLAGYDVLQEGMAVAAEFVAGGLLPGRLRTLAARVVAVDCLAAGASLPETFARLVEEHGLSPAKAWAVTVRVFRAGGLTKDAVYLRGLARLLRYMGSGGSLEPLLVGKIDLPHLGAIEELLERGVLEPPALQPRWTVRDGDQARLRRLAEGLTPLDLVAA
jgi:uncharacterized protein (TIGR02421 family)